MSGKLGHKQIAVMLTLMRLAREVSNPELEALVGFTLAGKDRTELNTEGLVSSRQRGRPYVHELTEKGWAWCHAHLGIGTAPAPRPRSVLAIAAYVVYSGLHDYMQRENLGPAAIFAAPAAVSPDEVESRIRAAYRKLASSSRDWVGLVDLRPLLGDAPTTDVDAVLKELSRTGQAHLAPMSNRKLLTDEDHAAAITIGGEENHRLLIEVP